jgi:RNA polymerase sigma factor (sigma-70 family)
MDEDEWLARRFEEHRPHLRTVAYRMLGSRSEADDAVQEAWLRLSRADTSGVVNLGGWLTTIVARVCLNMLQSRQSRREEPVGVHPPEPAADGDDVTDPERQTVLADSVGLALLVVLDILTPAERLAFVLHDMFEVPFDEIAPIIERSPAAARQLASRARRRVRGTATSPHTDPNRQRKIAAAFLAAARGGHFDALLALLDPDVVLRADRALVQMGAPKEVRGASAVATTFSGRAQAAQPALIDETVGAVVTSHGRPFIVLTFVFTHERITAIEMMADPERLSRLNVRILDH